MTLAVANRVSKKWRRLLCSLPGYDPFELAGDCCFDEDEAQRAIDFFPTFLTHVKGPKAGQPFELERWEQAIIANLFGWKRPDGLRRFREGFVFVPRKNGKTTFGAGIILYVETCDGEPGAEIYSSAKDRAQARLIFEPVKRMTLASPELSERLTVYRNSVIAVDPATGTETGTFYTPLSAEVSTKHGYNSHLIINDELHTHDDSELIDVLETSVGARAQPLILHITTSDYDRPSICNEKYDYACKVREGTIRDPAFLPVIYKADKDDDWTKVATWRKANPNYGVSVFVDYLKAKCLKAQENPRFENTFKRLHLNLRTEQAIRWISLDVWDGCSSPVVENELIGQSCFVGFDLASNTDIATYVMLFPPNSESELWRVVVRFYVPAENAEKREKKDKVPYVAWAREGFIKLTPGNVIDFATIKADFERDYQRFDMREIAFDRWNFEGLRQQFAADDIAEDKFVAFGQGYVSMSPACTELEKLLLAKKLAHSANPVLRWMAGNVAVEMDSAGNVKPSKKKSSEKIDGIVAILEAIGRARVTEPPKRSYYEDHDTLQS